jgi:AcrR family transcriptional regulator
MADTAQDKKDAILRASLKLFTERGFHGTPTAMISKEAGVSTGTLFRYFPTKEDLINATYAAAKAQLAKAITIGLEDERTVEGKVRRILGNTIRWSIANPREFLFVEQFSSSPYITQVTEEEVMRSYQFLDEVLDEGVRTGKIRDVKQDLTLFMLYGAISAAVKKSLRYGSDQDVDALIDESFKLVWGGISTD